MAFEGEIKGTSGAVRCEDCNSFLPLKVIYSAAWYIGRFCNNCGPYSRESGYYPSRVAAEADLKVWLEEGEKPNTRDTEYHGE